MWISSPFLYLSYPVTVFLLSHLKSFMEAMDMLREYLARDSERTLLISSHISSDLEGLCDDIYMIHDGKVVLHEDTDVILGEYGVLRVWIE